ncbi:MAG TPA: hypothetical protein VEJ87_15230 [Acidimicrobiales bacterium]|nr:hypothetical protein [Acidimicrobiales bacterium]
MTDQLESELREAFARRAAEVPADAVERLRRVDYRPHTRRRWPLTIGAFGAASGTAAAVSVLVLGGSPVAFAGWTATPILTSADQNGAAPGDCQTQLATAPGGSSPGSWSEVTTDARGPYTMTVYENGSNSLASCFTGPSFTTLQVETLNPASGGANTVSGEMAVSAIGQRAPTPQVTNAAVRLFSGGDVEQLLVSHLSQSANGTYTLVEGRLEPSVTAVTLVLSDGQQVTATVGNGWAVAWWPGNQDVASAQTTSASGTAIVPLKVANFAAPPRPAGSTAVLTHGSPDGPSLNQTSSAP